MALRTMWIFLKALILPLLFLANSICLGEGNKLELKNGFVNLNDFAPSILLDLKYHKDDNFTGATLPGCTSKKAVMTEETAIALKNVQEDLLSHGYLLVVYDAYHPRKAARRFTHWLGEADTDLKEIYYPNFTKEELNRAEYLQEKYAHIRGSTVDVSIISVKDKPASSGTPQKRIYRGSKSIIYLNDNTLEMGTSYDTFDPLSAYSNMLVPNEARLNRKFLRDTMQNYGFNPSEKFWWQFTLIRQPYIDSEFDFDI